MKNSLLIAAAIFMLAGCTNREKTGYINIQTVFNDFEYKKELEKELTVIKNSRKFVLDSMEASLKALSRQIREDKVNKDLVVRFQELREVFVEKRRQFGEDEERLVKQFDEKIIGQINSYVKEYGKREKYDIIYGATLSGNIMYADTTLDLTKPVIKFINEKFKGKL